MAHNGVHWRSTGLLLCPPSGNAKNAWHTCVSLYCANMMLAVVIFRYLFS